MLPATSRRGARRPATSFRPYNFMTPSPLIPVKEYVRMADRIPGRNLIAGRWLDAPDDFASTSPHSSEDVVGTFPRSDAGAALDAVAAARAAQPAWRRTSRVLRAE